MEKVPKIVKERLNQAAIAVDHPDPDVLTAFFERSLADRERTQVLEHLARCTDCRDVVALAQPADLPTPALVQPARGNWLTWPRLRWALVAAGVIVVGSLGALRYERSRQTGAVALFDAQRADGAPEESKKQPAPAPSPKQSAEERKTGGAQTESIHGGAKTDTLAESKKASDGAQALATLRPSQSDQKILIARENSGFRGQALPHGPMQPNQWQQNANMNATNQRLTLQSPVPAPATAPAANEQSVNGLTVSAQSSPTSQGRYVAQLPAAGGTIGGEVARAKDAQPAPTNSPQKQEAEAYDVSAASTSNFSPSGSLVPESPHWAINAAGGLQRSLDQGRTWQDVDVNNGVRDSTGTSLPMAMKSSRTKALAKDKESSSQKPIIFRAVSANGPDVWAGGAEGNLYHSSDAGDHWLRIVPSWRGVQLSGDILNLQFADIQHGRIITSSAEIWTTADGGQSWDKQ